MAILTIPDTNKRFGEFHQIRDYLQSLGILHDQWVPSVSLDGSEEQNAILDAYASVLKPFMEQGGYATADVICVRPETKGLDELRAKFLAEHTHTEDEVRIFIDGQGLFWFNPGGRGPVFAVLCEPGDLISVPAGTRHWFDLGERPYVKAIRIFTDPAGWVAHYTGSGIEEKYNKVQGLWK